MLRPGLAVAMLAAVPSRIGVSASFTDVAATAGVANDDTGQGVAWADYDGDGDLDAFVTNNGQANLLYQNQGSGTFFDVAATANVGDTGAGRGVAWAGFARAALARAGLSV